MSKTYHAIWHNYPLEKPKECGEYWVTRCSIGPAAIVLGHEAYDVSTEISYWDDYGFDPAQYDNWPVVAWTELLVPSTYAFTSSRRNHISSLGLSVRAENCLLRDGITTVEALCKKKESYLKTLRNFGPKSLAEVKGALSRYGLCLAKEDE